jgi:hypothetical protein
MSVNDAGPTVAFFGSNGSLRLSMQATDEASRFDALSSSGSRCLMGTEGGSPAIGVAGPDGKRTALLRVRDGSPEVALLDERSNIRAQLAIHPRATMLRLLDPGDVPRLSLIAAPIGPAVLLDGSSGKARALLSIDDNRGAPFLHMNDSDGKIVASLPR